MNILYDKGLVLCTEFLDISEELEIESHIPKTPKINQNTRNSIKRYGSNVPYKNQIESTTIPQYLESLSTKIVERGLLLSKPNSISINEYLPGNSIAPHIDSLESGQIITIISLLSDAIMVFSKNDEQYKITIPSRSIMQLKDEIRFEWKHSIEPVKLKRYSIVFRNG
jgi:alkylated DNA repair dioxygenase AlkB